MDCLQQAYRHRSYLTSISVRDVKHARFCKHASCHPLACTLLNTNCPRTFRIEESHSPHVCMSSRRPSSHKTWSVVRGQLGQGGGQGAGFPTASVSAMVSGLWEASNKLSQETMSAKNRKTEEVYG